MPVPARHGQRSSLRWPLAAALGCAALLAAGCASAPKGPVVARLTLRDASVSEKLPDGSIRHLGLASQSHTDRLTYYSTPRDEASLKIVEDAEMARLLGQLDALGFERRSRPGPANELDTKAIELERDGELRSFGVRSGSDAGDWKAMQSMTSHVLELFNNTFGGQAMRSGELPGGEVENRPKVVPLREVKKGSL
jgi:hypothetical protein